ncbi:hypothetical protein [Burkholderia gladioli]|uniref:hypothetical protein n=1 Tax=Burkholderia gladioli TaxID=28095 RepID=UPI001641A8BB|nr:hypothetical protein [Burkholderia gladioli]
MTTTTTDERAHFLQFQQQAWVADQHGAHASHSDSALFAGHTAHLQLETDGAWRLCYPVLRSDRIFHRVEAQRAAPAFVRDVLAHMAAPVDGSSPGAGLGGQA